MGYQKDMFMRYGRLNKTHVAKFKKGEEPNDIFFWLDQPIIERLKAVDVLRMQYNSWKYGSQSRLQRVYRAVKRQKS